jgi:hypothetical protein
MKKLFFISVAMIISATVALGQQQEEPTVVSNPQETVTPEQATHGQNVSEVARETGSGEMISIQARQQGEMKRAEKMRQRDQKRMDRAQRPERMVRPERPEKPERPERPERPVRPDKPNRPIKGGGK